MSGCVGDIWELGDLICQRMSPGSPGLLYPDSVSHVSMSPSVSSDVELQAEEARKEYESGS